VGKLFFLKRFLMILAVCPPYESEIAFSYLLTGDKRDFGLFFGKTIAGVMVVSPKLLAEDLVTKGFLPKK
jgi:hypothetical protein